MSNTWELSKGLAAVVTASAVAFGLCPSAAADPVAAQPTPQPNSTQQLPGLPALSQLSPIIQQAAGNPEQATQLLMAAAQAFTSHNPTAPTSQERGRVGEPVRSARGRGSRCAGSRCRDRAPSGRRRTCPQRHRAGPAVAPAGGYRSSPRGGPAAAAAPAPAAAAAPSPGAPSPALRPPRVSAPIRRQRRLHVPLDRDKLPGERQ